MMPLSTAEMRHNQEELDYIQQLLLSLDSSATAKQRLLYRFQSVREFLEEHHVLLGIPAGSISLQAILSEQIKRFNGDSFNAAMEAWLVQYRRFEQEATKQLQAQASRAAYGIANAICRGEEARQVWGTDYDIRLVLKGSITDPSAVTQPGRYILPPVSIVASSDASAEEKRAPHAFLASHIQTVCNQAIPGSVTLLVPVNAGQSHWMGCEVKVSEGKVVEAILRDSLKNPLLKESAAYKNLRAAVNHVNHGAHIMAFASGIQRDGYSCMDETVDFVLREKFPTTAQIPVELAAIRDASSAEKRRLEIMTRITTQLTPQLAPRVDAEQAVKAVFSSSVDLPAFEKHFEAVNAALVVPAAKKTQEQFDAIMAAKLEKLFIKQPQATDAALFNEARFYAYKKIQKQFGFFKPRSLSASEPIVESPLLQK
jgi:hypothetical protein